MGAPVKEADVTNEVRTIERMLRDIEHLVMEEMWLGRTRSIVATVAVTTLPMASAASGFALVRHRYRWCCAAAYCTALASVVGTGVFWWLRTGQSGAPLMLLTLADVAVVTLTIFWMTVIVTPVDRSQPDMRTTGGPQRC